MCTIKRLAEQIYKSGVPYEHTLIVNSDVFDAFMKIVGKKGKPSWLTRQEKINEDISNSTS